jgi:outer membrane murein-binding lipoprotein Lpp
MRVLAVILSFVMLTSCANTGPSRGTSAQVNALAATILALSPTVNSQEATRAAQIAYAYSFKLADQYQITDPPLIHNAKVNAGLRPRGLCYHWAEDMERRLNAEDFTTLDMTRAIANSENRFLIEHSTAVITAKGAPMQTGVLLDPWRLGGTLFWSPVQTDTRYTWKPRSDVLRAKGQIRYAQRTDSSVVPLPVDLTE